MVGEPSVDLGITVLLDNPNEVGADRLVNAVAAKSEYGGPLILIDFGTATTFDVIDGDGNYVGGIIAPGANLSMEALHMARGEAAPCRRASTGPCCGRRHGGGPCSLAFFTDTSP